jgi:hypothetical protein
MTSSPIPAARSQCLLDLLVQVPDPRKKRGRRHPLAGLLAVGIAAVMAGSRSFAAIGQWAADAGPEALARLGAARGASAGGDPHAGWVEVPSQARELLRVLFPHLPGLEVSRVADTGDAVVAFASVAGTQARCLPVRAGVVAGPRPLPAAAG